MNLRSSSTAAALACAVVAASLPAHAEAATPTNIDPWVLEATENTSAEFIVFLDEQADLAGVDKKRSRRKRGAAVHRLLTEQAAATQGPLLKRLREAGVEHRPYWIANMIWVRGNRALAEELAARKDVAHIYANPQVQMAPPQMQPADLLLGPQGIEQSLQQIGVPDTFWANGFTGEGIVIGGQDTGYDWDHPALINHYRGNNGATVDHNYHWHDSIHSGFGNPCGVDSPVPCDDNDHGTHTMGTMVGDDGASNQIGVAPGAKWIGCRNMDRGNGTPATYSECFEWFVAPTDLNGQNPRPDLAPHVINNSWSCPTSEGCTDPNVMLTVVNNARAAGIVVVVSAGNSGSGCSTVSTPAAIYDASTTVGSVNSFSEISSFSSRGPVTVDGSNRLKPDLVAPGENIRSSVVGGGYARFSGTSMSGPHVAGMTALLMSSQSCLERDPDAVEAFMKANAQFWTSTQNCGGVPGNIQPSNVYGYGEIRSALPGVADCVAPIGGGGAGLNLGSALAICIPPSGAAGRVIAEVDQALAFNCEAAGLDVSSGERVIMVLRGAASGTALQGTLTGVDGQVAICRNQTSGQSVNVPLGGADAWDCSAAGLSAAPGDSVQQILVGTAE
ncbi:MAG: S8 family serine peptidase [Pseudomonadota bacterium]